MPNIDGGHYFLTILMPVKTDPVQSGSGILTAPSHLLREALAYLPTAIQSPANVNASAISPFAQCRRTHFARLFVIDQAAYNGRDPSNAVLDGLRGNGSLLIHQPTDCQPNPWLVFAADFDVDPQAADGGLQDYLQGLWERTPQEMKAVFQFCHGFDHAFSASQFATWLRRGQVETTMPFNDYWPRSPQLPPSGLTRAAILAGIAAVAILLCTWATLRAIGQSYWWLLPALLLAIALPLYGLYRFVVAKGLESWPRAPAATLPDVLKSLYVQQAFARFAIAHQSDSAADLQDAFRQFRETVKLADLGEPTRLPGRVG